MDALNVVPGGIGRKGVAVGVVPVRSQLARLILPEADKLPAQRVCIGRTVRNTNIIVSKTEDANTAR